MENSSIEWCDHTINFLVGCDKVSEGCTNCYAETIENHYGREFTTLWGTDWVKIINDLKKWNPSRIFANSMTDMFHPDVPDFSIQSMVKVFKRFPKHEFQILTKRPDRMRGFSLKNIIPDNVWLGTSIELQKYVKPRLDALKQTKCVTKFVSFEPLLGMIDDVDLSGINQIIIGGESGNDARPMKKEWVDSLIYIAKQYDTPIFFKQWGTNKKCLCHGSKGCCLVDGIEYREYPTTKLGTKMVIKNC